MPRVYRLGKRAGQKETTRAAIVQAAIELYTEQGISHTSMAQVAHRADVAPATVSNHFAMKNELDEAIVDVVFAEIAIPDHTIYDGLGTLPERVARLATEMAAFMKRSERWYLMWATDPQMTEPWGTVVRSYYATMETLLAGALGELATDDDALAMLRALLDPRFFGALAEAGRSREEAASLIVASITPWLELRLKARR